MIFFKWQQYFSNRKPIFLQFPKKITFKIYIFCVHSVVLDYIFSVLRITFSKTLQTPTSFCMACLCMPLSMSDNLKIQIKKSSFLKTFALYNLCKIALMQFRSLPMHFKFRTSNLWWL